MTTRRQFLIRATLAVAAGAGGAWLWESWDRRTAADPAPVPFVQLASLPETALDLRALLAGFFSGSNLSAAARVGNVYLLRFARGGRGVVEDLAGPLRRVAEVRTPEEAVSILEEAVESDFEAGRLVDVDGWQLSVTEARLCGLAYQVFGRDRRASS